MPKQSKKEIWWCIKYQDDRLYIVHKDRRSCIQKFLDDRNIVFDTWTSCYQQGYRCVKIEIKEVKAK